MTGARALSPDADAPGRVCSAGGLPRSELEVHQHEVGDEHAVAAAREVDAEVGHASVEASLVASSRARVGEPVARAAREPEVGDDDQPRV